jgi:tetratricopeptide (TPR) repeat protein
MNRLLNIAIAIWLMGLANVAAAEDKVVLQRPNLASRMTISGLVVDYTGIEVSIRTDAGEPVRTFPAAEVVEIQTAQVAAHTQGLKLLAEGRVDEALRELELAIQKETRTWVRREILATIVRCGLRRGNYIMAGSRFLALLKSDPTTRDFRMIPLVWAPETISRDARTEARLWLAGQVEAGRLIGASLLYDDGESGVEARGVLKKLASSTDARIRPLAQMQAWRAEMFGGNPGRLQTAQWERRINELPEELRAGPLYLLGRAYAMRHDYELAAATLLWLPLIDDHDFRLAARACLEAGTALEKIGQQAEARTLYQEVVDRFADTTFADEAKALLNK